MNILFDGNYFFWKSWSVVQTYYKDSDLEKVLADPENQQKLIRKCVIDMCYTVNKFHDVERVAFVIDSSSWRYNFYANYKYSLTRVRDDYYKWFLKVLDDFEALLRKRGLIVSRVTGAEGDDLLYIWSVYFDKCLNEHLVIVTGDSDIRQIITKNVSLYNNNSKNLNIHCVADNVEYWKKYFNDEVEVVAVKPFEILLYKVIMGDKSDNIPKIKTGFGDKAFEKFIAWLGNYIVPEDVDIVYMSRWISSKFAEFIKVEEHDIYNNVYFNLQMTWLNLSTYNSNNYVSENGKTLLENMLDNVVTNKDKFSYNKPYTLEQFYGMAIK